MVLLLEMMVKFASHLVFLCKAPKKQIESMSGIAEHLPFIFRASSR